MDIKIELRNLYGLHTSSMQLEHAIKKNKDDPPAWKVFPPSRFIYAFFTFNSIYSIDWKSSFLKNKIQHWGKRNGQWPKEPEKFTGVIDFYFETLEDELQPILSLSLDKCLRNFDISDPVEKLSKILPLNETHEIKRLRMKMPTNFHSLLESELMTDDYKLALIDCLQFIYLVSIQKLS